MIKEDLEQEKFNKKLEEKLKVNYPEFKNKCDEVYRRCEENSKEKSKKDVLLIILFLFFFLLNVFFSMNFMKIESSISNSSDSDLKEEVSNIIKDASLHKE